MRQDFISVREASERYGYSGSHIRNLLIKGLIEGEKFASVWMVNVRSLERYKVRMEQLGKKKHGLRSGVPLTARATSATTGGSS